MAMRRLMSVFVQVGMNFSSAKGWVLEFGLWVP